jgi:hypothetical protein
MEIKKEILDETVHCKKDFECIKNNKTCCKVERSVDDKVLFVECSEKNSCKYRLAYGSYFICTCPTRIEIYRRFGR